MPFKSTGLLKTAFLLSVLIGLQGCTVKATTKTTTDGVVNFLSSTSGRSWFTPDGLVKSDVKAKAFLAMNWENLRRDVAAGQGEYLTSFETLLGVPPSDRSEFASRAQEHFSDVFSAHPSSVDRTVAALTSMKHSE